MATITPASGADRDDAAAFAGRLSRWDPVGPVRLRADGELIRLWGTTPFDTLVTRAVRGSLEPKDATVHAGNLLSALAVAANPAVASNAPPLTRDLNVGIRRSPSFAASVPL